MREARGPAWSDWLYERGVVALSGIDASLVLHLRQAGEHARDRAGRRGLGGRGARERAGTAEMAGRALAAKVSTREPCVFSDAGWTRVAVVDYGCKRSILNRLAWAGAAVTVYPHDVDADELARYDGVLLSGSPGDPAPLKDRASNTVQLGWTCPDARDLPRPPAARARDGARDVQAPVRPPRGPTIRSSSATGRVLVTSQNHGFAVAPSEAREGPHVSLYDGTVEGLDFPELPRTSVQFHPEAGPGPHDAWGLLDRWLKEVGGLAEAA